MIKFHFLQITHKIKVSMRCAMDELMGIIKYNSTMALRNLTTSCNVQMEKPIVKHAGLLLSSSVKRATNACTAVKVKKTFYGN